MMVLESSQKRGGGIKSLEAEFKAKCWRGRLDGQHFSRMKREVAGIKAHSEREGLAADVTIATIDITCQQETFSVANMVVWMQDMVGLFKKSGARGKKKVAIK
jgi:hypothetical protein